MPELAAQVLLDGAVAVEVVGGQVEDGADAAAEGVDVLELEARELTGDPHVRVDQPRERRERPADVARHLAWQPARFQHRAEQVGRGRLPVRPGDARDRVGEHPCGQLDLGPDGHACSAGSLDLVRLRRNPRALHYRTQSFDRHNVTPEDGFDADLAKPPHVQIGAAVGGEHLRPRPHAQDRLARRNPAPRQTHHQIARAHRYFEKNR